ncbi:Outer membrane protein tolC precursor [Bacteroidales bacterium Barb6XT]|nr:Outer membrane protein tolC precursor [Bacteroidales bacterium Barb6XT]
MNRLSDKMKYIAVSLILLAAVPLRAQIATQWTLEECIRYAIEHNITLKQGEQVEEARRTDLNTSRHSWLPDLNAGVSQNFDFGRSPSKTGVIVDQNSANSSFSLQLNMPLFDGFWTANDIAARRLDLLAATENLSKAKEDLAVGVASYYLQVLYNKELLGIAELQASLTAEQVKKTEALVQAGKVPLSQLYDMKAQLARDEVSLVEARNNVSLALLDLAQSLELERSGDFDIPVPVVPDVVEAYMASIVPPDHIYDQAVTFKPQIKEQEYLLQSQQKTLKIAQSGYYPRLNLNASYSNGYYSYSGENVASNTPFGEQLKQNERKTIGLSLSIPIFNRFQVRNSVRSARINIRNRELMMENTKKALYKEIQQAYYSATASQESYIASGKSVAAGKEAFTYAEERYGNGKSTVFEYGEAKTKYARSLAEQTQAKYNFIFRAKILDFYKGMPIRL